VLDISSDESREEKMSGSPPFIPVSPATLRAIELLEESDIGSDWSEFDDVPQSTTNNTAVRVKRVARRQSRPSSTKVSAKRRPRQNRPTLTKVSAGRRPVARRADAKGQSSRSSIRDNILRGGGGATVAGMTEEELAGMTEEELKVLYPEFISAGCTVKKEPWS
jgi:hypothetical protein